MYRSERWPEEAPEPPPPPPPQPRSRSSSRRNSASQSRRSSLKKDKSPLNSAPSSATSTPKKTPKKSPLNSAPPSTTSTPKKTAKPQNLEFLVTGKQIVKRADRANSLPGSYHRRQSVDVTIRGRKMSEIPKRVRPAQSSPKSHESCEATLEEDMSLDLSQVSDFEDTNSKYGIRNNFATSSPLSSLPPATPATPATPAPRCASLQSQIHTQRVETRRAQHSVDHSNKHSFTSSRDSSIFNTSTSISSPYRGGPELDYSSVSPEYSGQSSAELSPRTLPTRASQQALSPRSQALSSCCVSTWAECSSAEGARGARGEGGEGVVGVAGDPLDGEWCAFWANYNNSLPSVPVKGYYDRCPTPYRTDNVDLADWEFSDGSRKRSPDNVEVINNIIRHQGLHLTPRETQNIIKCTHLLGNVLSKAIDRRSKITDDPELLTKKKTMTLDLKETIVPLEVKEEKKCESATTQTDISLPNTKSAPRIFENILRQLSRSSIDVEKIENKVKSEANSEGKSNNGDVTVDNQVKHEMEKEG